MECVARVRALKVTRQQAARIGHAVPEEADPEEIKHQLRRMWTEVRSHVERAGTSVSARHAVQRKSLSGFIGIFPSSAF